MKDKGLCIECNKKPIAYGANKYCSAKCRDKVIKRNNLLKAQQQRNKSIEMTKKYYTPYKIPVTIVDKNTYISLVNLPLNESIRIGYNCTFIHLGIKAKKVIVSKPRKGCQFNREYKTNAYALKDIEKAINSNEKKYKETTRFWYRNSVLRLMKLWNVMNEHLKGIQ